VLEPAPEPPRLPSVNTGEAPEPAPQPIHIARSPQPLERLGALIEVLLCSGLPTQILVVGALASIGMQPRIANGDLSSRFVIALSLIDMMLVLGLVWLFLRAHDERIREFVLGRRRVGREILLGLALIPGAFLLTLVVLLVILATKPGLHNVPVNPFESLMQTPEGAAMFAVVAMLAGGVREEIQRAFIVRRFGQYLGGSVLGIVLHGAVFGLGHVQQGYAIAIVTGSLGVAWGFVYRARGAVVATMVSHAGFNLAQLVKYVTLGA
jgi:membrane protease YdiL (CAAX protease family)